MGMCWGMQGHPCAGEVCQGQGKAARTGVWIHRPKVAQPGEAPGEPWMSFHDLEACGHDQGGLAAEVVVATDVESSCVVIRIREVEA